MKIVVIGGTGLIGSKLVTKLREHGHDAVPASPNTGVNTLTGEGLAEALAGAASSSTCRTPRRWRTRRCSSSSRRRPATSSTPKRRPACGHHVALSVVGTERLSESGYIRAKIAQEKLIKAVFDPVLDRPRDAVLRVRHAHRRRRDRRRHSAASHRCCSSRWRPRMSRRPLVESPWDRLSTPLSKWPGPSSFVWTSSFGTSSAHGRICAKW